MEEFAGKVALVTGGARGLGAAISRRLASGGCRVMVADRDVEPAREVAEQLVGEGYGAASMELDVRDARQIQDAASAVKDSFGAVDFLINNAGISRAKPFLENSDADWDAHLDINLKGTFLMCRAFLPDMIAQKSGRIVNMSSALGRQGFPGYAAYCASKFGVVGLTQSIAAEFGRHGITANCVVPGIVKTRMWDGEGGTLTTAYSSEEEAEAFIQASIPLGRTQDAEDIAEMVGYLVSEKARNITAATFHVDGGLVPR